MASNFGTIRNRGERFNFAAVDSSNPAICTPTDQTNPSIELLNDKNPQELSHTGAGAPHWAAQSLPMAGPDASILWPQLYLSNPNLWVTVK